MTGRDVISPAPGMKGALSSELSLGRNKNQPGWPSDWAKWEVSIHQMWLQSHLGDCSYNFLDELLWITSLKLMRKSATGVRSTSHVMGLVIISVEENYWGPDVGHVECECWEVSPLLITNLITPVIQPATVTNQTGSLEVRDSNVAVANNLSQLLSGHRSYPHGLWVP